MPILSFSYTVCGFVAMVTPNTLHPLTLIPCILIDSWFIPLSIYDPFPHFLNWKDNLNVEHFIKDLLFINFHQIYELVSMATKFFKVHGISEKEINI